MTVAVVVVTASFAVAEADKAEDKAKDATHAMAEKAAVKCIVCDKACEKAIEVKAGDQTLSVCCEACVEKVKANPDEFVKKQAEASKDKPAKSE